MALDIPEPQNGGKTQPMAVPASRRPPFEGIAAGYAGADRAEQHADRVIPAWSTVARGLFLRFLAASGVGTCFVTEDVRRWCVANGLADPPDARAFGNLTRFAAAKGLIVDTGRRPRAGSHGREIVEWEIVGIER